MSHTIRTAAFAAVLTAFPSFARADVLVVDASGGGAFTDLPPAVAAARDGDVLIVRSGSYSGFTVTNEALDLVAERGAAVIVNGTVRIQGLAVTRAVTVTGFEVRGAAGQRALILDKNAGAVRIEACTLVGGDALGCVGEAEGSEAAVAFGCADLAIARSTLRGGNGADQDPFAGRGGAGLWASDTLVAVHESSLRGGNGGDWTDQCAAGSSGYGYGAAGGMGALAQGSNTRAFFVSGCDLRGGDGGGMFASGSVFTGWGGPGLEAIQPAVGALRALDNHYSPGVPGPGTGPPGGTFGPLHLNGAPLTTYAGAARRLDVSRVVREGESARVQVFGQPGDLVTLFVAEEPGFVAAHELRGVRLVARTQSTTVMQAGVIGANGKLVLAWAVGELGPKIENRRRFFQALCTDATGVRTLTGPATLVLLDSAF